MPQLDQSQRAFCESSKQNIRLLAPAGCGKTLTLLYRCREISWRFDSQPRFLIVTFTKVAAAELTERLAANTEFSSVRDHIRVTTLNAYGWQRIRDHRRNPRLLSDLQSRNVKAADGAHDATIEIPKTTSITERLELVTDITRAVETPGKVAVIGRVRRQLIPYEIYYAADGAPFKTANDLDIFNSKAFDSLIELLDIWEQSSDRVRPAKATDGAVKICDFIKRYPLNKSDRSNLSDHILRRSPRSVMAAVAEIASYSGPDLRGKTAEQLYEVANSFIESGSVADALKQVQSGFTGLSFDYDKADIDVWFSAPPLEQISEIAESENMDADSLIGRFETAKNRLKEYRALEGRDEDAGGLGEIMERPLHLMTATRAKGKEYDTVILLDTNEGIWPHPKSAEDPQKLEAERRLFYVAFTRARRKVVMLADDNRTLSRFVSEMGIEP